MTTTDQRWPIYADDEIEAVCAVLKSGCTNYWTGTNCRTFEKEYAAHIGVPHAVALMNGTIALEAALFALGIGANDEVITPCRTFIASASCIVMRGATPIVADVDLESQNISAKTIEPCITAKTKAIIVVHLAGRPADMESIMALAKKYNLKVIEDCAQAHGATINGKQVGSFGDIGAFSFCQDKIISTGGEGGMLTTHDESLWQKVWAFKDHGKSYAKIYATEHPPGFRYLHDQFGTNWRMTEMQAAIGLQQLKKLPQWINIRKQHAARLTERLSQHPALFIPPVPPHMTHAFYRYYVFIQPNQLANGWDRDRIMAEMNKRGYPCFVGSCSDISLEKAFAEYEFTNRRERQNAKRLGETSLAFLVDPSVSAERIEKTAQSLLQVLDRASITEREYS